ncbi:MAG: methyltransferase domain-containing protein [Bacteroidetes bacterium]|nr:methyltransferase domain-containing protein [Bacteroidota bacterium]
MNYIGDELELFREARKWKSYYASILHQWIRGVVIEAGAGIGGSTPFLFNDAVESWNCVEPDARFRDALLAVEASLAEKAPVAIHIGKLRSLAGASADCILYIDVLEHIEDDGDELEYAASCLKPGGHIVVLAPAHQFLYSAFDRAIGHFRRYDRESIRACIPANCQLKGPWFLDSLGMALSLGNRLLLKQSAPTPTQIRFWDSWLLPISRLLDFLFRYSIGKTVVWVLERKG